MSVHKCVCVRLYLPLCVLFTSNLKFIVTGLRFVHTIFYHSNKFVYTILHTKNEKMKMRTGSTLVTETMREIEKKKTKNGIVEINYFTIIV